MLLYPNMKIHRTSTESSAYRTNDIVNRHHNRSFCVVRLIGSSLSNVREARVALIAHNQLSPNTRIIAKFHVVNAETAAVINVANVGATYLSRSRANFNGRPLYNGNCPMSVPRNAATINTPIKISLDLLLMRRNGSGEYEEVRAQRRENVFSTEPFTMS
jgi:archaellum component FlaF (FlaF/FlaG flagellin family)